MRISLRTVIFLFAVVLVPSRGNPSIEPVKRPKPHDYDEETPQLPPPQLGGPPKSKNGKPGRSISANGASYSYTSPVSFYMLPPKYAGFYQGPPLKAVRIESPQVPRVQVSSSFSMGGLGRQFSSMASTLAGKTDGLRNTAYGATSGLVAGTMGVARGMKDVTKQMMGPPNGGAHGFASPHGGLQMQAQYQQSYPSRTNGLRDTVGNAAYDVTTGLLAAPVGLIKGVKDSALQVVSSDPRQGGNQHMYPPPSPRPPSQYHQQQQTPGYYYQSSSYGHG